MMGLAAGIAAGAGGVFSAISSVASGVMSAFTGKLLIHSPSRVFMAYGRFTAQGYAEGVERGAPEADAALGAMVSMPAGDVGVRGANPRASRGGKTFTFIFQISGVENAESLKEPSFLDRLASTLEEEMLLGGISLDDGETV